jgi:hypothetical protein
MVEAGAMKVSAGPGRKRKLAVPMVLSLSLALSCKSNGCSNGTTTDDQIRAFCENLFASPAFACCSAADRAAPQFAVRNKYASAADCTNQLLEAISGSDGKRTYDPNAANGCLGYLGSRGCNVTPTSALQIAEQKAGCDRVVVGVQGEGKGCDSSADCQVGLFCPPVKDTGSSTCARPAAATEACLGILPIFEVDHPSCQPGLFCEFLQRNPDDTCPTPPCNVYGCVPFFDECAPGSDVSTCDPCTALECGPPSVTGLYCLDGFCRKSGPSPAGQPCRVTEACQPGLFCDPAQNAGTCVQRKTAGNPCRSGTDPELGLECQGICRGGQAGGVCAAFCGAP